MDWLKDVVSKINQAAKIMGLDKVSDNELRERFKARTLNDQLKAQAAKTYGDNFFQLYDYYWGLSLSEQSEFRKNNPTEYAMIQAYRKDREAFGEANPLWAKYYLEPKKDTAGGGGGGGGGRAGGGGGGAARARAAVPPGGFVSPGLRSTLDVSYLAPYNLGRAGTARAPVWPRWLLEKIGEVMAAEVAALVKDGTVLPPQVEEYLKNLAVRSSDARLTVEPTLVLNEKAKVIVTSGGGGGGPRMVE